MKRGENGQLSQRAANFLSFNDIDQTKLKQIVRDKRRGSTASVIPEFLKKIKTLKHVNGKTVETFQNCIWEDEESFMVSQTGSDNTQTQHRMFQSPE